MPRLWIYTPGVDLDILPTGRDLNPRPPRCSMRCMCVCDGRFLNPSPAFAAAQCGARPLFLFFSLRNPSNSFGFLAKRVEKEFRLDAQAVDLDARGRFKYSSDWARPKSAARHAAPMCCLCVCDARFLNPSPAFAAAQCGARPLFLFFSLRNPSNFFGFPAKLVEKEFRGPAQR